MPPAVPLAVGRIMFASTIIPVEDLALVKRAAPVLLLALFWVWETWRPFFGNTDGRLRHAAHNVALALFNTIVLGLAFGSATVLVAEWAGRTGSGLLNALDM